MPHRTSPSETVVDGGPSSALKPMSASGLGHTSMGCSQLVAEHSRDAKAGPFLETWVSSLKPALSCTTIQEASSPLFFAWSWFVSWSHGSLSIFLLLPHVLSQGLPLIKSLYTSPCLGYNKVIMFKSFIENCLLKTHYVRHFDSGLQFSLDKMQSLDSRS